MTEEQADLGETPNVRIQNITAVSMLCMAGLYDLVSLIPFAPFVIIPVAWLHFWMWFERHGINIGFTNPKKLLTMGGTSLIEAIPALGNISPTWILGIGLQLLLVRIEDKTGVSPRTVEDLKKSLKEKDKMKLLRRAQQPPANTLRVASRARRAQILRRRRERNGKQRVTDIKKRSDDTTGAL